MSDGAENRMPHLPGGRGAIGYARVAGELEARAPRYPGAAMLGQGAPGETRLAHYPGEDAAPLVPAEAANTNLPFDLDELFDDLVKKWKDARDHSSAWRKEARESYDMVAGRQWDADAERILKETNRPAITFNRTGPMVSIVCGLESGNPHDINFFPREEGDAVRNEIITEAVKWFRDQCDADDEDSDAFWDLVVSGMGWAGVELDYELDPDGTVCVERIDPIMMYWDCAARKKNLSDARCLFKLKQVSRSEARRLYPNAELSDLHAAWAIDSSDPDVDDADDDRFYRANTRDSETVPQQVTLVEAQWVQRVVRWRVADPLSGQTTMLSAEEMAVLQERLPMIGLSIPAAVKQNVRVYWRAVLGSKVLHVWPGPKKGGYTWKCMTGARDRNKGTWYGIVRAMIDPQRWANKWLSQSMHIMNSGAKGGIIAETGAFPDMREAEKDWNDPTAFVEANDGALAAGKIMPRPQNPMPPGLADLLTLALTSIRDCTGINLELLGLVEHDQPGIVEHQRKQAGMTVLASLFRALRRYRKDQGRTLLHYVNDYLSDGRLIRIVGDGRAKYVPLVRQPGVAEYDVVVDEAPTSPNMVEKTWGALMQMMPFLSRAPVPPDVYLELLKYSPLPATVTEKITEIIKNTPQQPDPIAIAAQGQAEMNQARARLTDAQTQKTLVDTALGSHQVRAENARTQLDAVKTALEAQEIKAKIENLRSAALLNLSKAGATQQDSQTGQLLGVLEMLDTLVSWHQGATEAAQAA